MKRYGQSSKEIMCDHYLLPSAKWNLPGKSGVAKNMLRNTKIKRLLRTSMKRITRQRAKKEIQEIIYEMITEHTDHG